MRAHALPGGLSPPLTARARFCCVAGPRVGGEGHKSLLAAIRMLLDVACREHQQQQQQQHQHAVDAPPAPLAAARRAWALAVVAELRRHLAEGSWGPDADALTQQALVAAALSLAAKVSAVLCEPRSHSGHDLIGSFATAACTMIGSNMFLLRMYQCYAWHSRRVGFAPGVI